MKNNTYKILVLSDLKKSVESDLKSTISLAKMIGGDITLFHIKKPIDLVARESQLSAMRTINKEHLVADTKMKALVKSCKKDFGLSIDYKLAIGNLKNEIETYIKTHKPDVIVVGKRKSKPFNLIGDNVINFVLKKHHGILMIAGNHTLHPNDELSLGVLNTNDKAVNLEFIEGLLEKSKHPVKAFNIIKRADRGPKPEKTSIGEKMVEYVFEDANKAIDSVSKYASKSNINLMCADKTDTNLKNLIDKLNVSILLTEKQPSILQN